MFDNVRLQWKGFRKKWILICMQGKLPDARISNNAKTEHRIDFPWFLRFESELRNIFLNANLSKQVAELAPCDWPSMIYRKYSYEAL